VKSVFEQLKWNGRKLSMDFRDWVKEGGAAYVTGAQWGEDREESPPGDTHFSYEV
jgi:hypothetical protein